MTTITGKLAESMRTYFAELKDWGAASPKAMRKALAEYDAQRGDVESDPAAILVHAYAKAGDSGSVEWEDINQAHEAARAQLGPERCAEIDALYTDD